MANTEQDDITAMLAAWANGNKDALDRLTSLLYPEFRRIARRYLGRRTGESLESAALANEVYLKLTSAGTIRCEDRTHFLALCAQMIRHILVDHVRRRKSTKRGGDAPHVPLDEVLLQVETADWKWSHWTAPCVHWLKSTLVRAAWWSCVISAD